MGGIEFMSTFTSEKAVLPQETATTTFTDRLAAAVELAKPRVLAMIVFTTLLTYLIAATDPLVPAHMLHTALGVLFAAGGALALNQHMEHHLDSKMARTLHRPIPSGRISPRAAFVLGMSTMIFGYVYLWVAVNPGCSIATMICGISYLYMYTPLKLRSSMSTFVGAIPGGMLPIMGWFAARDRLEIGAWILFAILFLWQIPHALIISIRHQNDYRRVGMKQLPIISKPLTTNRQMILNILILIPITIMPYYVNMTEIIYPITALVLGFALFVFVVRFGMVRDSRSAKSVFLALNAYLPLLLLIMYLNKPS